MKCSRANCDRTAAWRPTLLLYAKGHSKHSHKPMEAEFHLYICNAHKETLTPADFITDDGWAAICDSVLRMGRVEPDRASVELSWERIT